MNALSYNAKVIIAVAAEAIYLLGRTIVRGAFTDDIAQELVWTAWRLLFVILYLGLFLEVVRSQSQKRGMPWHPALVLAVVISLAAQPLAGLGLAVTSQYGAVLALTSPIVALREELFYRAILQAALERRLGGLGAIMMSTAAFVASHIGSQPMNIVAVTDLAASGVLYGAIYQRTRNLWIVVVLHAMYDIVIALSPRVAIFGPSIVPWANLLMFVLAVLWFLIDRQHNKGRARNE